MRVEFADGRLEIAEPRQRLGRRRIDSGLDVVITLPVGSHCWITTASADVTANGELGSLTAKTISGEITADTVSGATEAATTSGRISVDDAAGRVWAKSASGDIELGHVRGDVDANTVSGKVEIGRAAASVSARTASGRVKIGNLSRGLAEIASVSGDVKVGVAKGVGVYLDMASVSGRVTSELEPSEPSDEVDLRLQCRSTSGAIKVARSDHSDVS